MPYLGTFRPKFEKSIVISKTSTLEFDKMQSFMLKLLKVAIFGLKLKITVVIFEINTLEFVKMRSFM